MWDCFAANVEPGNVAFVRALTKAGLIPQDPNRNLEENGYYVWRRERASERP